MSHVSDSKYHKDATLSLSLPECLSTCTLLSPTNTCFTAKKGRKERKRIKIENVDMERH